MSLLRDLLLGIDVGTTGTKTMLVTRSGEVLSESYKAYALDRPKPFHVEQDPEDWWEAVCETVRECTLQHGSRVRAVAVSAQGGSLLATDEEFHPLAPARSWLDRRADAQGEQLAARFGRRDFFQRTGWPLYGAYTAVQLLNMRETEPALFAAAAHFFGTADFINSRLVGRAVGEANSIGITQLADARTHDWDDEILDFIGVHRNQLFSITAPGVAFGPLSDDSAIALGLPADVTVVAGGHDQYCAALGAGVVGDGDLLISTGTAWVALGVAVDPVHDPGMGYALGSHVVEGLWAQFGSFRNGGVCLDWVRSLLRGSGEPDDYDTVNHESALSGFGARGLSFYPFFDGTTIPTWTDSAKGVFLDVELRHTKSDFYRAVMEGVAFELRRVIDALERFTAPASRIRVLGGAAKSDVWLDIISGVLGQRLEVLDIPNSACLGAAMLAGVGSDCWPDAGAADAEVVRTVTRHEQSKEVRTEYDRLYARYLRTSDALLSLYRERAAEGGPNEALPAHRLGS